MGKKLESFKKIALPVTELVVASGVTLVCNSVMKEHVPEQEKKIQKLLVGIGTWAICNYVGTKVTEHVVSTVDSKIDQVTETVDEVKEAVDSINRRNNTEYVDACYQEVVKDGPK